MEGNGGGGPDFVSLDRAKQLLSISSLTVVICSNAIYKRLTRKKEKEKGKISSNYCKKFKLLKIKYSI